MAVGLLEAGCIRKSLLQEALNCQATVKCSENVIDIFCTHAAERSALIVLGENKSRPTLFERCAVAKLSILLREGWRVRVLDFGLHDATPDRRPPRKISPGQQVARALRETEAL